MQSAPTVTAHQPAQPMQAISQQMLPVQVKQQTPSHSQLYKNKHKRCRRHIPALTPTAQQARLTGTQLRSSSHMITEAIIQNSFSRQPVRISKAHPQFASIHLNMPKSKPCPAVPLHPTPFQQLTPGLQLPSCSPLRPCHPFDACWPTSHGLHIYA